MDFLDRVKSFVEENVDLSTFDRPYLSIGLLKNSNDVSIALAPSPSPDKLLDGQRVYYCGFQIYVRHEDQRVAIGTCQAIESLLDGATNGAIKSEDGSFDLVRIDATTTTNFVEKTSEGYAYTAIFDAELFV